MPVLGADAVERGKTTAVTLRHQHATPQAPNTAVQDQSQHTKAVGIQSPLSLVLGPAQGGLRTTRCRDSLGASGGDLLSDSDARLEHSARSSEHICCDPELPKVLNACALNHRQEL